MTIECKKCSMHEECICDASADECLIRKQSYNKAIDDVMKKAKEIQEEQIKNLEQSPKRSGKQWAVYMNTHLGHIQIACKRLIADHPAKESED